MRPSYISLCGCRLLLLRHNTGWALKKKSAVSRTVCGLVSHESNKACGWDLTQQPPPSATVQWFSAACHLEPKVKIAPLGFLLEKPHTTLARLEMFCGCVLLLNCFFTDHICAAKRGKAPDPRASAKIQFHVWICLLKEFHYWERKKSIWCVFWGWFSSFFPFVKWNISHKQVLCLVFKWNDGTLKKM